MSSEVVFTSGCSFFLYGGASAHFRSMASPLPWCPDYLEFLRVPNVRRSPYPGCGVPGLLSLSGATLKICPAWVAVPAARMLPAWLSQMKYTDENINTACTAWIRFMFVFCVRARTGVQRTQNQFGKIICFSIFPPILALIPVFFKSTHNIL